MIIRSFDWQDLSACLPLMADLGYQTDEETLARRWESFLQSPDYHLWAMAEEGQVIGLVGFHQMYFFEADGTYIRILALVVSSAHRRKGLASKLLDAVRDYAISHNCKVLALNSGLSAERSVAHHFYQVYGFSKKSAGFTHPLDH